MSDMHCARCGQWLGDGRVLSWDMTSNKYYCVSGCAPARPMTKALDAAGAEELAKEIAEHLRVPRWDEMGEWLEDNGERIAAYLSENATLRRQLEEADAVIAFELSPLDDYRPADRQAHTEHIREAIARHSARSASSSPEGTHEE